MDGAGEMLHYLFGGQLNEPSKRWDTIGEIVTFDQHEFQEGNFDAGLGERGFAYVPDKCKLITRVSYDS